MRKKKKKKVKNGKFRLGLGFKLKMRDWGFVWISKIEQRTCFVCNFGFWFGIPVILYCNVFKLIAKTLVVV